MIVYFSNRNMNIVGQASTGLPDGLHIRDDKKKEELETGTKSLEFYLYYSDRAKAEMMTTPGNYILKSTNGDGEFYTIIDATTDLSERSIHVYAEDAGIDLINEVVGEYTASSAMSIEEYVDVFAIDTGFEIGINEVSDQTKTLSWTSEETTTARLQSLAEEFGAELSFSFDVDKLSVLHKYINFWKRRGSETNARLRIGQHIRNVRITRSVANLVTALLVRGGTASGSSSPVTLSGYTYDDGDIYVDGEYLKSRSALETWSRYLSPTEGARIGTGDIVRVWKCDATTQSSLCARAVTELTKSSKMEITYEAEVIELPKSASIGDVVKIADEEGNQYIKLRITELVTSESDGRKDITLSDYTTRS